MTVTIDSNYINQFSGNMYNLVEQKMSKTRGIFNTEMANGEKHFFDRLGSLSANEIVGRLQAPVLQDPAHSRRMATVGRFETSVTLDNIDKLKMLIDPTSDYSIKMAAALGRKYDEVVFNALLGSAATGQTGSGSTAFDSNNVIAAGGTGFTVAKFDQALRILEAAEVDVDGDLFLFIDAYGIEDLLGDSTNKLTSFDFQGDNYVLNGGKLPQYRGVNVIRTQRVPVVSSTDNRALLCTRDALKVAMAHDLEVKTAERPDLNFALQLSAYMMMGAVRMEEAQVVDIKFVK